MLVSIKNTTSYYIHYNTIIHTTLFSVPTRLSRYGLSEIVNYLILGNDNETNEKHIPYDFLINGQFLRTSLSKYIKQHALNVVCIIVL